MKNGPKAKCCDPKHIVGILLTAVDVFVIGAWQSTGYRVAYLQ